MLIGDTTQQPVWQQLKGLLNEVWTREDGSQLSIKMLAVDAGFNTQNVYDFVREVGLNRAVPIKGQESQQQIVSSPRDVQIGRTGKKIPGIKLWLVGVSMVKHEIYAWLRQTVLEDGSEPHGYCHFPQYDQRYFKGLTAEKVQYRITRGYRKPEWVKHYERNEPLDCRVYARVAATIVGIDRMTHEDWQKLLEIKVIETVPKLKPKRTDIDSFWGSRR